MDLKAEAALGRPFGHLSGRSRSALPRCEHLHASRRAVVHAPDDELAHADDLEPVVAKMAGQHFKEALQVVPLLPGILAVEIERDADRQVAIAPHAIERIVVVRKHAAACGVNDAGHPDARQSLEERPDASHLTVEADLGDPGEQPREGEKVAAHHTGRLAVGAALELAGGRHLGIVVQAELRHAGRADDGVIVEMLNIDRRVRGDLRQFLRRRPTLFGELRLVPPATDHDPGGGPRFRGLREALEPLCERRHVGPVGLHRVGEAGAHRMDMRVDQAGNDRPPAEIDDLRIGADAAPYRLLLADRHDGVLPDGQRSRHRGGGIERDDVPVREHQVLGIAEHDRGQDHCNAQRPRFHRSHATPPLRFPGS